MPTTRLRLFALVTAVLLLLVGCFDLDQPLIERMEIEFDTSGETRVTVTTDVDMEPDEGGPTLLVDEYLARVEAADDPWRASLLAAAPKSERYTLIREEGRIRRIERELVVWDPDRIVGLFTHDAVRAGFVVDGPTRMLSLTPVGTLADGADSEYIEKRRPELIRHAKALLEAIISLYRMIETHPDRRPAIMGLVYGEESLTEADAEILTGLLASGSEEEVKARAAFEAALTALGEFLYDRPKDGQLEELMYASRRVLHPLRASLQVRVSGPVRAYAGFVPIGNDGRQFALPEISFLGALTDVALGIVRPLPRVINGERMAEPEGTDNEPEKMELTELVEQEILAGPVPADLEARFAAALRPAPQYSIEWQVDDAPQRQPQPPAAPALIPAGPDANGGG